MTTILDDALVSDLEPFEGWGSPLVVQVGQTPYPVLNTILDADCPAGAPNPWLSSDRLREVKRRYDPDNAFHINHTIRIGEG